MKVLVLGSKGMAGHMVHRYFLSVGHDVVGISRKECDMRDTQKLLDIISAGKCDYIINCAGILNSNAEDNKSEAIFVNSFLPHFIAEHIKNTKTKLIQISTDCVFSGNKGGYTENDVLDGTKAYDKTKALGEIIDDRNLTVRTSIIGPDMNPNGIGLFNWFMKQSGAVKGFSKAIWSGVTTLELVRFLDFAMNKNITGLYHLTNSIPINKFDLLNIFNDTFKKGLVIVSETEFHVDKSFINTRKDFVYNVRSYREQISDMKDWIDKNKDLYPHYLEAK